MYIIIITTINYNVICDFSFKLSCAESLANLNMP